MLRTLLFVTALFCLCSSLSAAVVGDGAIVHNTLIDAQTGGAEFYVGAETTTIADPGLDFDDFLGLYDVDFSEDSLVMSLVGNSALDGVPLMFPGDPNPRFDTYYYFFDAHDVTSVSLDSASGEAQLDEHLGVALDWFLSRTSPTNSMAAVEKTVRLLTNRLPLVSERFRGFA